MSPALQGTLDLVWTAYKTVLLVSEMMACSAEMLNMAEVPVMLGGLVMDLPSQECSKGVRLSTEREIVRNIWLWSIPNVNLGMPLSDAAFAGQ